MAVHDVSTEVLCADVGRVGLAENLPQTKALVPDPLLDPQLADREVADSADSAALADADSRGGIDQQRKRFADTQVKRNGLGAEPFASPMHRSTELGLGGGQRQHLLRAAVVPDQVCSAEAHT